MWQKKQEYFWQITLFNLIEEQQTFVPSSMRIHMEKEWQENNSIIKAGHFDFEHSAVLREAIGIWWPLEFYHPYILCMWAGTSASIFIRIGARLSYLVHLLESIMVHHRRTASV